MRNKVFISNATPDDKASRSMPPNCLDDFFEIVRNRYENKPTIFTSNRRFEDWAVIFGDKVLAGAVIDRIVHHSYIVRITGESYRVKDFLKQSEPFE